jgi:3-phosphoglycerate kinase
VYRKKGVRDLCVTPGDRALVRVDYNVTFVGDTGQISDDSRIVESLPTIEYLLERQCRVILCSHIGRPHGRRDSRYSLTPVALRLSEIMQRPIALAPDCVGREVEAAIADMSPGHILMLENLRFHIGEESNDGRFARSLANLADFYVNDGFGVAHRRHASTAGVTEFLPSVAGFLIESEVNALDSVIHTPEHPYVIVMGGAKVSDKVPVIDRLADVADVFLIGGGMAASFLCAQGKLDYESVVDMDDVELALRVLDRAHVNDVELVLPRDVVVAGIFDESADPVTTGVDSIPGGHVVMDIGPKTVRAYSQRLRAARTVVWNGPMGVFEWPSFSHGTRALAHAIADLKDAYTVTGGGSTADVVRSLGLQDGFSHVSTGGGATLEYLEGRDLPGIAALDGN